MSDSANSVNDDYEENDQTLPVFFLFFMMLLALVLLLGRALHNRPMLNSYLSEPAMVLIVSVLVSFVVKIFFGTEDSSNSGQEEQDGGYYDGYYAYNDNDDRNDEQQSSNSYYGSVDQNQLSKFLLTFSGELFFMVFLPPIMFHSGYELKRELFFRHLKPIVSFAVVGTAISGIVTGMILWGASTLGWTGEVTPNLWELLTFGALITATDTVSVLGVLNAKQVNPHLFSLVFGESALNDAVAIVMFQSFSRLVRLGGISDQQSLVHEATHFAVEFLMDVLACPMLGMTISFLAALVFKKVDFHGTPVLELSLYILLMYIPFILAEVLEMSGIITIFVTGIFARRYIEPNVTDETKHNAEVIFNLVAYLAETCIFLNLGMSVFGFSGHFHWAFISCAFVASLIGRAMSIYPISFLYNWSLVECMEGRPDIISRRKTVDVAIDNNVEDDITMAMSALETTNNEMIEKNKNNHDVTCFEVEKIGTSAATLSVRRTPAKSLDKVIPAKFTHFLWFAGLRGAVAYACAREFPDVYGNKNEIIAATMVIVFFSVIVMGACCEPLLHSLKIRMGVDSDEYMREWRNRRSLKGSFHRFEKRFIYDVVVRDSYMEDDAEQVDQAFNFAATNGSMQQSMSSERTTTMNTERATTASTSARTLTGSAYFMSL